MKHAVKASIASIALVVGLLVGLPSKASAAQTWYAYAGTGAIEVTVQGNYLVVNRWSGDWSRVSTGVFATWMDPQCFFAGVSNGSLLYGNLRGAAYLTFRSRVPGLTCRWTGTSFWSGGQSVNSTVIRPWGTNNPGFSTYVRPYDRGTYVTVSIG